MHLLLPASFSPTAILWLPKLSLEKQSSDGGCQKSYDTALHQVLWSSPCCETGLWPTPPEQILAPRVPSVHSTR